jgi:hypothetical protein
LRAIAALYIYNLDFISLPMSSQMRLKVLGDND